MAARFGLIGLALVVSTGCTAINAYEDPVIVAKWEGMTDARNELDVRIDGGKDALIFFSIGTDPTAYQVDFDFEWEQTKRDRFEFDMKCDNTNAPMGCSGLPKFKMECDLEGDDEMVCLGEDFWVNYPFDWKL